MKDDETYYEYTEPGDWPGETVTYRRSRTSILAQYGPHWRERMRQAGKVILHPQISDDRCIEDWCVVHWAYEVKP